MAGKAYDFVSSASQEPDATVILSSASESKIGITFCKFVLLTFKLYDAYILPSTLNRFL